MDVTKESLDLINNYFTELYPYKEEAYIKIFNKDGNRLKFYNIDTIKNKDKLKNILNSFERDDLFISMNSFKTMEKATNGNLFAINSIAVDIDYKKKANFKNLKPNQIINLLELDYFGQVIPEPNYIEYSNQLRLIYILDEVVFLPKKCKDVKTLINRISQVFADHLKDFGAEIQKSEKFLRIPLTINNKSKDVVYIRKYSDYKYKLSDLQELWLEELPNWYDKWKDKKQRKSKKFNIYQFNKERLKDFKKVQTYLNETNQIDCRKRLCFLYHNYSLLVLKADIEAKNKEKTAINMMLEFNNNFKVPLKENSIISDTKFLRNKQYIYSNKTLIDFLEIDDHLLEVLNLNSIFKTLSKEERNKIYYEHNKDNILKKKTKNYNSIKAREKYKEKLKSQGKLSRAEENNILREDIKDLLAQGFSQVDIANKLNYSYKTIKRHVAFIKKERLLQ